MSGSAFEVQHWLLKSVDYALPPNRCRVYIFGPLRSGPFAGGARVALQEIGVALQSLRAPAIPVEARTQDDGCVQAELARRAEMKRCSLAVPFNNVSQGLAARSG